MTRINRILCPIDFSPFSERALAYAMNMTARSGATLKVLHVIPLMPPSTVSPLSAASRELCARNLQSAVERTRLPGAEVHTELIESAEPAARIRDAASAFAADLIVTGSHDRSGVKRVVLGSVVETLLHSCPVPILVVPSHCDPHAGEAKVSRVMCAVDFSESSLSAVAKALAIAEGTQARLTLLHVIEPPPVQRWLRPRSPFSLDQDDNMARALVEAASLERLRALIPLHTRERLSVEVMVLEGDASQQLLRMATEGQADLIVLGVHGRNALDLAFLGSHARDLLRQAHCPVLVVPASHRYAAARAAS